MLPFIIARDNQPAQLLINGNLEVLHLLKMIQVLGHALDLALLFRRKYWGIESGLHCHRDVTLHEGATRLTVGASSHNMAIINNLVIASV